MRLEELSQGQGVLLEIVKGDEHSEVDANVMMVSRNVVVLEPIIIEGKVLVLNDTEIHVSLVLSIEDEKPQLWKNVAFGMTIISNRQCIVIKSVNESVTYNRRGSYRLPMDNQGYLKNEKIIIHDISTTGLSFYTNKDNRKTVGSNVEIRFMAHYEEIHVKGTIVREIEDGDRYLYGCIIHASPAVDSYIASEQRKRVMLHRRNV